MRFLPSLRGTKAAEAERASGLATYRFGVPYTPPGVGRDVERIVADTYDRVTWVFRAVDAIASSAAALEVEVLQGDPVEGLELEDHPLLRLLNYQANPDTLTSATEFRYRLSSQLLLSSRGAFVEVKRDRNGDPQALSLLPPQHTRPIPDPNTFVSGYEVTIGASKWTVPAERVQWIRRPHPLDPYRSVTPVEAAGIAIDMDWLAKVYGATFLRNDGRPGGLVGVRGQLNPTDADELKDFFAGGIARAGEWRVLEAEGIDVADMATTPRDAQYVESRALSKDEVLLAFGVPESVMGNASGRTFDNADAEREVFWQETMLPHLRFIAASLDLIDGNPDTFVVYDLDDVEALQRAQTARRQEKRDEFDRGLITHNEYRTAVGYDPVAQPEADRLYIGSSFTPLYAGDVEEPTPPAPVLTIAPEPAEPAAGLEEAAAAAPAVKSADADPPARRRRATSRSSGRSPSST